MNFTEQIINNIIPIIFIAIVIAVIIYFFDNKKNNYSESEVKKVKKDIKEKNFTYLGKIELLSFFPKPFILLGVIFFWTFWILVAIYFFL